MDNSATLTLASSTTDGVANSTDAQSAATADLGSSSKNSRRRTKTGCLTCRRRRIKCGEERPICNNCIKSKRNCEGYNQRAVYRDPTIDVHGFPIDEVPLQSDPAALQYHHHVSGPGPLDYASFGFRPPSPQLPLAPLAPRPAPAYDGTSSYGTNAAFSGSSSGHHSQNLNQEISPNQSVNSEHFSWQGLPVGSHDGLSMSDPGFSSISGSDPRRHSDMSIPAASSNLPDGHQDPHSYSSGSQLPLPQFDPPKAPNTDVTGSTARTDQFATLTKSLSAEEDDDFDSDGGMDYETSAMDDAKIDTQNQHKAGLLVAIQACQPDHQQNTNTSNILATYRPSGLGSPLADPRTAKIFSHFVTVTAPILSVHERHAIHPTLLFGGRRVPHSQQGLWTYTMPTLALSSPPLLHAMLSLACLQIAKLTGSSVLPSLKHYHMALRRVARYVGIPSKRNGIDTFAATLLLGFYEVASGEQSKWNKHLLGARQLLVETDFLGMTRRIKSMKAEEDLRALHRSLNDSNDPQSQASVRIYNYMRETYLGPDRDVDERLIDELTGRHSQYDTNGQLIPEEEHKPRYPLPARPMTAKDIDDYDIRRDLYWWFLKQDVIQSAISSNSLLLDYRKWTHCPPRAPIGQLHATYGTFDHLILLLGRVANFASKDLSRKRKAVEAMGGAWRPPPSMDMGRGPGPPGQSGPSGPPAASGHPGFQGIPGAPASQIPQPSTVPNGQQQAAPGGMQMPPAPLMTGMMPAPPKAEMPQAFVNDASSSPASSQEDQDLEVATAEAVAEWLSIKRALEAFDSHLGPDFQALQTDPIGHSATPFGPAIRYRTTAVAAIRLYLIMAKIIHLRVHPSMPPAAMMAAGVAARQTAMLANEVGRVLGGLVAPDASSAKDPSFDSMLLDASLPLFFAGVQYQDAAQRGWTIHKLNNIAERLGWGPVLTIASGCEHAWEKAAQMGRGPPYVRTMNPWAKDDRIAGRPLNPSSPVTEDNDRRFIPTDAGARLHWAVGVLGIEDAVGTLTV